MDRTFTSTSGTTIAWDPARGAKITSLRGADGREWLTQPGLRKSAPGASFGDAEMAGWDECAPTITACRVGAHELPDHGDAWDAAWDDKGQEVSHRGTAWPYRLTRWVTQTESGSIRLEYEASATRDAIAFLWAAHPQFAAMPGTRVVIPDPPRTVVDVLTEEHLSEPWDERLMSIDCVDRGSHRKLYLPPEHSGIIRDACACGRVGAHSAVVAGMSLSRPVVRQCVDRPASGHRNRAESGVRRLPSSGRGGWARTHHPPACATAVVDRDRDCSMTTRCDRGQVLVNPSERLASVYADYLRLQRKDAP